MKEQRCNSKWKKQFIRSIFAFMLAIVVVGTAIPVIDGTVYVEAESGQSSTATGKTISGLGSNGIGKPKPGYQFDPNLSTIENTGHDIAWEGSYVYYGKYEYALSSETSEVRPVKYRVLDPRTTRFSGNDNTTTMLLDCDTILCQEKFHTDCMKEGCNKWANSPIRTFLNGNGFYGNTSFFTALEKTSIAASTIATHHLGSYGNSVAVPMHGPTAANFQDYTALEGDHVFLLDAEDLSNTAYGYTNDAQGKNRDKIAPGLSDYQGDYWTRSAQHVSDNIAYRVGYVCGHVIQNIDPSSPYYNPDITYYLDGGLNVKQTNMGCGVSPAFNVDLSKVIFSSPIAGETNCHKLTLLDSDFVLSVTEGTVEKGDDAYTVNVRYTLSYGSIGNTPTQLSYVVTNGTWSNTGGWSADAEVLQYGKVIIDESTIVNGTGSFSIAGTGLSGVWGSDYHVYLVAEDVNTVYDTDYAGAPVEVKAVAADAEDVTVTYDGGGHGIRVSFAAPETGVSIRYGETANHCDSNTSPSYTAATVNSPETVYYEAAASGYLTMKGSAKVTINKAPLTVKAKDKTITYGDAPANNGLECTGFVNNETVSVLSDQNCTYTYTQGNAAGEYSISPADTITADNYDIIRQNGKLTVEKKEAVINWSNTTLTYNGMVQAPTATVENLCAGDSCDVTVSGGRENVGSNYTATASGLSNTNYKLPSNVTQSFKIVKANPVVVLSANTLIYNEKEQKLVTKSKVSGGTLYFAVTEKSNPAPAFDGTSSDPNGKWGTSIPRKCDAGDWRVWYKFKGDANHNDSLDGQYIDVTITRAPTKIIAEDRAVKPGATITLDPKLDVNAYAIYGYTSNDPTIATVDDSGIVIGVACGTATISINAITTDHGYEAPPDKTIQVVVTDKNIQEDFEFTSSTKKKTYGDSDFSLEATGAAEGSTVSYSSSDPSVATIDASTGLVHIMKAGKTTIRAHASGTDSYVSANAACALTVEKRSVKITALDKRIKVGDTVPDLTHPVKGTDYSVSGLLETDSLGVDIEMSYPEAPDNTKEGRYTIRIDGPQEDQDKYNYIYKDGTLTIYEEIVVPPHSHSFTESVTKDPTCVDTGVKTFRCTGCGYSYTQTIPALGHDFSGEFTVTKEPGCIEPGEKQCKCSRCEEKETQTIEPLGHDFSGEFTVTKEASCTEPGEKQCKCTRCEEKEPQVIEPLGHDFSGKFTVTKEATCTESGEKICQCTRCEEKQTQLIEPLGHDFSGVYTVKKEATCIEKGERVCVCKRCSEEEVLPIPPKGHSYSGWWIAVVPTSVNYGLRGKECHSCGDIVWEHIPATGKPTKEEEQFLADAGREGIARVDEVILDEDGKESGREVTSSVSGQVVEKTIIGADGEVTVETVQWAGGLQEDYPYNGGNVIPDFRMYDGLELLKEGKDYVVNIKNSKKVGDKATVTVSFKGDYKDLPDLIKEFTIEPADLEKDVKADNTAIVSNGKNQTPLPTLIWNGSKKKITKEEFNTKYRKIMASDPSIGGNNSEFSPDLLGDLPDDVNLGEETDTISEPGIYQVTVTPLNGNFTGSLTSLIYVVSNKNQLLSEAKVTLKTRKYTWTGSEIIPDKNSYSLTLGGTALKEGTDYTVDLIDNVDPGKATIKFIAVDGNDKGIAGVKTSEFNIVKGRELKQGDGFNFDVASEVPYAKGGAKPAVTVKDGEEELVEGVDYTVSYSKNRNVTKEPTAVATVKGKGKYKGSVKLNYAVSKQNLENLTDYVIAADKIESKKGYKKPSVTITDTDGKKLKAGADYEIKADSYVITDQFGTEKTQNNAQPGDTITVTILGKGANYEGSVDISYRYIKPSNQLGKVKANKLMDKSFTGREIIPDRNELSRLLYTGNKNAPNYLEPGKDFIIEGCTNNIKTGVAKVTLKGIDDWGGTKTLSFKITPKR